MTVLLDKVVLTWLVLLITLSEIHGAGKVFIGYPPFIDNVTPNPTEFVFYAHDPSGAIPVYIEVFNDTNPGEALPISDNVVVNCETVFAAPGFSSATFQAVTLGPATNYSDVNVINFVSGRVINVRCFGESQIPPPAANTTAPPPQFTKETSWSDPLPFQVKPSPTVNFCQAVFTVPDRYLLEESTFELEFSEAVEGGLDNLNVSCSVQSIPVSPVPELDIFINTTAAYPKFGLDRNASFVLLVVPYTIQNKGSAVSVQCSAQSYVNNQYLFSTSAGSPSQFEVEEGSVHLYPEYPDFIKSTSPSIKTVISLDSPVSSEDQQVVFLCQATVENDTQVAISKVETPDCSFTVQPVTTTAAPTTTPPNATVDVNATAAPTTRPGQNLSLWEVIPSTVDIQTGGIFHSLRLLRTEDVTSPELELVLLTCCAPAEINNSPKYANRSVATLTSVFLQPPTTNWSLASDSSQAYVERTIPNPAYVEVAPCACDVTARACDVECCCDQDCSADERATFSSCISGLIGGQDRPNPTHFCNSTHVYKEDWFPLMCVEFQSSAVLGSFFSNQAAARTIQSFYQKILSVSPSFTYRETGRRNVPETVVGSAGYKYGQRLKTAQPTATGGLSAVSGVLSLPQRTIGGHCLRTAPVRFLKDLTSDCTYGLTPDLCVADSVLSARMYAEATGITNPPCPRTYHVLSVEDSSGKEVSEARTTYLCSADNAGFLNTPDTRSTTLDPYTTSLFDYTMPPENCQDDFGNDICANPEDTGTVAASRPALPPRCAFDDGFSQAPAPLYNTTTRICHNAVLSVRYDFTWSGQRIVFLNTTVVLGDLPMEVTWQENRTIVYTDSSNVTQRNTTLVDRSTPAVLNQQYTVLFHHNYTDLEDTSVSQGSNTRYDRSGYPGYNAGKLVHSGKAIVNTTTDTFFYVNSNLSNQITLFDTGLDGLCFNAGKKQITFQDDSVSSCAVRLDFDTVDNCTSLRKLVLNRLNSMMPADRLGRFGFLNSNDDGFWVPVIRQDLTEYFVTEPTPNMTVDVFDSLEELLNATVFILGDNIRGRCANLTTGIQLEVLYGETGKTMGASILEIVGAKISYTLGTWEMTCSGSNSARCYGNQSLDTGGESGMVESFFLTTSVRFTRVPTNIPVQPIRFWQTHNPALCHQDACWPGLFYPLTEEYTGEQRFYTLVWTQLIVFGLFFYFLITRPWW